jgi:single-stranded-DNA-specific exonuclease
MKWNIKSDQIPKSIADVTSILIANREITDFSTFQKPAHPSSMTVSEVGIDPDQTQKAVALIREAVASDKSILVFGDYDADGISATTVLWQTLHALGARALPFIPHREKHGYGLSQRSLNEILAQGKPDLVITVDNGIVAHEPVARLKEAGVQVIVTDHHQPELDPVTSHSLFPPADAIVHTTQLCGTTVAWMLAKELLPDNVEESLDMCGLATIADQVPLLNANRSFAFWGIEAIKRSQRVGLKALADIAGVELAKVTTNSINFGLVPRINAMGRVSHGMDALRLMCTNSTERADQLVETLQLTNLRRQDLTGTYLSLARAEADTWEDEHIIISASPEYHEGVIGLIAGRLVEEFAKPAIVIAVGEKVAKASARSIEGINIVELIREVRDDLLEVGGHPMAAGFGLLPEKISSVISRLQASAKERIDENQLQPSLRLECLLPTEVITFELTDMLKTFEPFGQGNQVPVFGLQDLEITALQTLGKENQHLKLSVTHPSTQFQLTSLAWNLASLAEHVTVGSRINMAGQIEVNDWKGRRSLQMVVKDLLLSKSD